jgi:NAD(P)-dependent dehydrogenase (short-subunit alcohol dehydrogenase family)
VTAAGASAYVASKHALTGFSGCLRDEVKAFGITVTNIEPGFFRTPLLTQGETGSGGRVAKSRMGEYDFIMDPMMQGFNFLTGKEPGDPVKGAKVMVDLLKGEGLFEGKEVPASLVLGKEILAMVQQFKEADTKSLEEWKVISESTEFEGAVDLLKDLV